MFGRISVLVLAAAALTSTGWAQRATEDLPEVRSSRIDEAPKLDGLVDEDLWSEIEPATGFVQQNPDEGAPSTERTEIRIAFDDSNLYFGIICFDSQPENIVVTQNRRDGSLIDTDSIQILIDTYNPFPTARMHSCSGPAPRESSSTPRSPRPARHGGQGEARPVRGEPAEAAHSVPEQRRSISTGTQSGRCVRR